MTKFNTMTAANIRVDVKAIRLAIEQALEAWNEQSEGEGPAALGVDRVRNKSGYEWEAGFGAEERDISHMTVFRTDLDAHGVNVVELAEEVLFAWEAEWDELDDDLAA